MNSAQALLGLKVSARMVEVIRIMEFILSVASRKRAVRVQGEDPPGSRMNQYFTYRTLRERPFGYQWLPIQDYHHVDPSLDTYLERSELIHGQQNRPYSDRF